MEITSNTQTYLVLNKLPTEEKLTLKRNIEALNYFYIASESVLICSNLDVQKVVDAIFQDIKESEAGKITVIQLNCGLLGKGKEVLFSSSKETVFDK